MSSTRCAFASPHAISRPNCNHAALCTRRQGLGVSRTATNQSSRRRHTPSMQIPPDGHISPPLAEKDRGPPEYKWDPDYPGTLKPGKVDDNFPLERVLASPVYENMEYDELDMDERCQQTFEPDDDLLEWLMKQGRLIPRDAEDEELDVDSDAPGITEEDLNMDYGDDDSKMIAYYSRQGEGSSLGASSDFGGFSESSVDVDAGF